MNDRLKNTRTMQRSFMGLVAFSALLVLGIAPSAIAMSQPTTVKVWRASSVVKAPDGTITARLIFKAKDSACLSAIPFDREDPASLALTLTGFPGEAPVGSPPIFQLPRVGRAAYQVILPPETTVTVVVEKSSGGLEKKQFLASQAKLGTVQVGFKYHHHDLSWRRKSKKLGPVVCVPQHGQLFHHL